MKNGYQVVVVGGGVVGCSVLYHLTKNGWTDIALLERTELTAGSTWHAAGGMHTLNGDPNVASLQRYTVELYQEIERESGQDCGIHLTGGLMLADTPERMDWLRMAHARGRYLGMETELLSASEAKQLMPFIEEQYFVGAMYDRHEGHVDPTGVTNAYAISARNAGAEVHRNSWARSITRRPDGGWDIEVYETSTGETQQIVRADHVVNAGGLWAREVGRMVGIELPVLAMEHMYLLTEDVPELTEFNQQHGELLGGIDFGGEIYMRQEGNGLLLGTYEKNAVPWSVDETPWDFSMRLLPPDLDRIAESLDIGFKHFPIFAETGIKRVINGPFTFAPDGNPLLGPIRGLPGFWSACAVMAGLSQGGGVGLALANWITEGDPGFDVWGMDVARFGDFATRSYTRTKVHENYSRRFRITFPNEYLPAARELITSPIYDQLVAHNAVWGDSFGLETALWFQKPGLEPAEEVTFGRSNAWGQVREEVHAVRNAVGVMETTGFAKFAVEGPGARAWLEQMSTNRVPQPGRMALAPLVNAKGKLAGDLTIACLAPANGTPEGPATASTGGATQNMRSEESFLLFGSGIAERYYQRWFDQHLPTDGSVHYRALGLGLCGLSIAGPNSRELLARLTDTDVSNDQFRFMDFRRLDIGHAPTWCGRVSFTGDLGYEIWMEPGYQRRVFSELISHGEDLGIRPFGLAALDSLRLDKSFGSWAREFRPIYDPFEAGLGSFVRDGEFLGAAALREARAAGPVRQLCTWTIEPGTGPQGAGAGGDEAADVMGDEPIWHDGEVVGWVTSGGYAHHSNASVALGYVPAEVASATDGFEIEVLGVRRLAQRIDGCLWDPAGAVMRS